MSAELLRQAATLLRDDFEREDVEDLTSAEFHLAVADWLDTVARSLDFEARLGLTVIKPGSPAAAAVVVARAYLGRPL